MFTSQHHDTVHAAVLLAYFATLVSISDQRCVGSRSKYGPPKKGKKRKKKKKKKKEKTDILHAVILNVHTMKFCVLELATLDSSNINIYLSDLYNTLGAKNQNGGCSWKIISAVVLESPKTHPPASTDTDAS